MRRHLEEIAFRQADIVIASGSDESLTAIHRHVRGRFIGYGHKVSFSVIGKEALAQSQQLARAAAYDVALFDQQGCLSPQLIYVEEGGVIRPKEFAALLARELTLLATTTSPRKNLAGGKRGHLQGAR